MEIVTVLEVYTTFISKSFLSYFYLLLRVHKVLNNFIGRSLEAFEITEHICSNSELIGI
jgi:hypothetical protein